MPTLVQDGLLITYNPHQTELIKAGQTGYPGIFVQSLDLAWQAHLSNQILTVPTITKAQNDALQSLTIALTKLKHVRKCLRNPKSPADIVRASIGFLEVCLLKIQMSNLPQ
jgi:hypothetical protein